MQNTQKIVSKKVVSIFMAFLFIILSVPFAFASEGLAPVLVGDPPIATEVEAGSRLSASKLSGGAVKHPETGEILTDAVWKWQSSRTTVLSSGMYPAYCASPSLTVPLKMDIYVGIIGDLKETEIEIYPAIETMNYVPNTFYKDLSIKGGKAVEKGTTTEVVGKFVVAEKSETRLLSVGTIDIYIKFIPDDLDTYLPIEFTIPVTVNKATVKFVDESGNEIVPEITLDRSLKVGSDLNGYLKQYLNVSSCSFNWEETEGYKEKIKPGTHEYTVKTIIDDPNYERYGNLTFKVIVNKEKIEGTVQGDVGGKKLYFKEAYELYGTFDIKYFINGKEEGIIKINVGEVFNIPQNKSGVYTYEITYNGTADDYYDVTVIAPAPEDIKLSHNVTVNGVATPYTYGAPVTVTAPANEKPYYVFTGWSEVKGDIGDAKADTAEVKFTMPDEDVEFTATYEFDFIEFIKWIFATIADWFKTVFAFIGGAFK